MCHSAEHLLRLRAATINQRWAPLFWAFTSFGPPGGVRLSRLYREARFIYGGSVSYSSLSRSWDCFALFWLPSLAHEPDYQKQNISEARHEMTFCLPIPALSMRRRTQTQARCRAASDHEIKNANRPMDLTTMPSALLSQILRTQDLRQKHVVAGHRGRSA